jgi:hypothetical protein
VTKIGNYSELQFAIICYMAGRGCSAPEIAMDSRITSDEFEVAFLIDRLGFPPLPKNGDDRSFIIDLPTKLIPVLEKHANKRMVLPSALIIRILNCVLGYDRVAEILEIGVPE